MKHFNQYFNKHFNKLLNKYVSKQFNKDYNKRLNLHFNKHFDKKMHTFIDKQLNKEREPKRVNEDRWSSSVVRKVATSVLESSGRSSHRCLSKRTSSTCTCYSCPSPRCTYRMQLPNYPRYSTNHPRIFEVAPFVCQVPFSITPVPTRSTNISRIFIGNILKSPSTHKRPIFIE